MIGLSSSYLRPRPSTLAVAAAAFGLGWAAAQIATPPPGRPTAIATAALPPPPTARAPAAELAPLPAPETSAARPAAAIDQEAMADATAAPDVPGADTAASNDAAPGSPADGTLVDATTAPQLTEALAVGWPPAAGPHGAPSLLPLPELEPSPEPIAEATRLAELAEDDPGPAARAIEVQKGDTLLGILMRAGVDRAEAHEAIETLKGVYDPHALKVGQALEVSFAPAADSETNARLASLSLGIDLERDLRLVRGEDGSFAAQTIDRPLHHESALAQGEIRTSLYDSARAAGMPPETIAAFVKLLSWDVDFQRDIHPGHRFETLYERAVDETGRIVRSGDLLYGRLELEGRSHAVYRFELEDGRVGYYDPNGRSARRSLLRTPIDGARLSSGFGMRRHPILGFSRMHKGIDFAAPVGTPVYAAGDGTIEVAGRHAAYGKYVRIRHNSVYATAYAHLSRYGQGIQPGRRVAQGQLIGYVGTTGLSTGPHLHYEILERGRQVNPLKVRQDAVDALTGKDLQRFRQRRDEIDRLRRDLLSGTEVAQAGGEAEAASPPRR